MNDTIASLLNYFSKHSKIEFNHCVKIKFKQYSTKQFRRYLYNPEPYYNFCGVKNNNTEALLQHYRANAKISMDSDDIEIYDPILKSDTRRQFETILAKVLLIDLAQDKALSQLLNDIYKQALAVYYNADSKLNTYVKNINLKKLQMSDFMKNIIHTNINDTAAPLKKVGLEKNMAAQFYDAYRQYTHDQQGFSREVNRTIRIGLRLIILTQYIGWTLDDICKAIYKNKQQKVHLLQDRTFLRLFHSNSLYSNDLRFRYRGRVERPDINYRSQWRGISHPSDEGSSKAAPDILKTASPLWSPANSSKPSSEPNAYYIESPNDKMPDGWLVNAIKRHQPFVNSISGLCLIFSSQVEILLEMKIAEEAYFKLEQFLAAMIVYYTGGHSFYESIKGFKVGRVARKLGYLKWQRFCNDVLSDQVIDKTIKQLEKLR